MIPSETLFDPGVNLVCHYTVLTRLLHLYKATERRILDSLAPKVNFMQT